MLSTCWVGPPAGAPLMMPDMSKDVSRPRPTVGELVPEQRKQKALGALTFSQLEARHVGEIVESRQTFDVGRLLGQIVRIPDAETDIAGMLSRSDQHLVYGGMVLDVRDLVHVELMVRLDLVPWDLVLGKLLAIHADELTLVYNLRLCAEKVWLTFHSHLLVCR